MLNVGHRRSGGAAAGLLLLVMTALAVLCFIATAIMLAQFAIRAFEYSVWASLAATVVLAAGCALQLAAVKRGVDRRSLKSGALTVLATALSAALVNLVFIILIALFESPWVFRRLGL